MRLSLSPNRSPNNASPETFRSNSAPHSNRNPPMSAPFEPTGGRSTTNAPQSPGPSPTRSLHQIIMPPARGAGAGASSGGGGCPFHHLHKNLAALQQQGNGLLAAQPPLTWAALAVAGTALLAFVAYRLVLALFAKRYKVPAKGGAVVITGVWIGYAGWVRSWSCPCLRFGRPLLRAPIDRSIDRHTNGVVNPTTMHRRVHGHREPCRAGAGGAGLHRVRHGAEAGGRGGARRAGPRAEPPPHHHGRGQAGMWRVFGMCWRRVEVEGRTHLGPIRMITLILVCAG